MGIWLSLIESLFDKFNWIPFYTDFAIYNFTTQ